MSSPKRLIYTAVRMQTLGGVIEIKPSTDGFHVTFELAKDYPCGSYGKTIELAGTALVGRLKELTAAVEADIQAFIERNK